MSGWTNTTATVPWVVVDPATGNVVYRVETTGTTLIGPQGQIINVVDGDGQPTIRFATPDGTHFSYINAPVVNGNPTIGINMSPFASAIFAGKTLHARLFLNASQSSLGLIDSAQLAVGGSFSFNENGAQIATQDIAGNVVSELQTKNDGTVGIIGRLFSSGEGWQNVALANTWVTRPISGTATFDPMSFKKDVSGRVFLRGEIQGGTSAGGSVINATPIPAAYRPPTNAHDGPIGSADLTGASAGSPRMRIDTAGNFSIFGTGPGPISFGGYSWDTVTL